MDRDDGGGSVLGTGREGGAPTGSGDPPDGPRGAVRMTVVTVHAQYAQFVHRSLQQLGCRTADLPDLGQKVFIAVHHGLPSFKPGHPMPNWLFGICKNIVSDYRGSAPIRREVSQRDIVDASTEDLEPNPEQCLRIKQARIILNELLAELEPQQRAVLVMYEIDRMTYLDIAEALGISRGKVSYQLRTARAAFIQALARREARLSKGGPK